MHAEVFLILTTKGLVALPKDENNNIITNQEPWSCLYVQIESVAACPSRIEDHFGIQLNFYNKDASASKVVVHTFDCKEQVDLDEDGEERKATDVL